MRVLVADDERDMADALVAVLEQERYAVDAVGDGRSALEYALAGGYDCLVLDIMMPGLDGIEVVRALRERGDATPVLMLTARGSASDRVAGLDAGADDYLVKPFHMGEFLARVRACARRSPALVPSVLRVGDLELDRAAYTLSCTRGGAVERLSGKEYLIMEQLMRASGAPVSPDRMRERAWGYDAYVSQNVIWTYIYKLRKILRELGSTCTIRSSRGLGYVLDDGI